MGAFISAVERWRPLVLAEWRRAGYTWSPSQYLSVIQQESGGNPQAHHPGSGAHGLGQVIPGTLASYRQTTGDQAADYEFNPETQIRVGAWVYDRGVKRARSVTVARDADPDLRWHLADIVYSVGGGTLNKVLAALGHPPASLAELEAAMPVPLPRNRPYHHARVVTSRARRDDPALPISGWTPGAQKEGQGGWIDEETLIALALAVAAAVAVWILVR